MSNIAAVPNHVTGDQFTQGMWEVLQGNLNDGIVNQVCAARVFRSTSVGTSASYTTYNFDTVRFDPEGVWDSAGSFVCKTPGVYNFGAQVNWPTDSVANLIEVRLRWNNSTTIAEQSGLGRTGGGMGQCLAGGWEFAAGDSLTLQVLSGSDLVITGNYEMWWKRT